MKTLLDSTCPRCGFRSSTQGVSVEVAREIAAAHVCADGVKTVSGAPVERVVPGPGERTFPSMSMERRILTSLRDRPTQTLLSMENMLDEATTNDTPSRNDALLAGVRLVLKERGILPNRVS